MALLKRWINPTPLTLLFVSALSIALALLGNHDPLVRNLVCKSIGFCPWSEHAAAWNRAFYDLGIGGLVSLFFYWLLVRLPEGRKRRRIKRSLILHYRLFRSDTIKVILRVVEGTYDLEQVDALMDHKSFRAYFKQYVSPSMDKWHVFQNEIESDDLREIVTAMEVFRDEVLFALNNSDIESDRPFEFFKRMSNAIYYLKSTELGYDSTERLTNFLWDLLAGFSFITGDREEDVVEEMIGSI